MKYWLCGAAVRVLRWQQDISESQGHSQLTMTLSERFADEMAKVELYASAIPYYKRVVSVD